MPVIVYISWQFYGSMAERSMFYVFPQMLILVLGVLWSLGLIYAYPLMVTYRMTFPQLVKNAVILGIGRLPQSIGIRLITLLPAAICLLLFLFWVIMTRRSKKREPQAEFEESLESEESFESAAPVDEIPAEEAAEVPSADIPAGEETAENPDKKPLV